METIQIIPSDNIFQELGNNTYSFDEAISELIDNSIAARLNNIVNVEISLFINNNTGKCDKLIIKDNASGIKYSNIPVCFNPAGKQTKSSLNEHGLGFKQSISTLGDLEYFDSKCLNEVGFRICDFSFNLTIYDLENKSFDNGTEICINIENNSFVDISKKNHIAKTKRLSNQLGARYRRWIDKNCLTIKINTILDDEIINSVNTESVRPFYCNPWRGGINEPLVKKRFEVNKSVVELVFGYSPKTDEEFQRIGLIKSDYEIKSGGNTVNEIYALSSKSAGLDLIMNDRVIKFQQLDEIGLYGTRESWYNQIRGELILLEGFKTTSTKNDIIKTDDFTEIINQIILFLTNGYGNRRSVESSDEKKYKNELNLNLMTNGYLKKGLSSGVVNEEKLQDLVEKRLTSPFSSHKKIEKEYVIEKLGVKVDFLVDGNPWELKNQKCTSHDISQLLTYLVSLDKKMGCIVAPDFNEASKFLVEKIESSLGYKIEMMESKVFY